MTFATDFLSSSLPVGSEGKEPDLMRFGVVCVCFCVFSCLCCFVGSSG